PAARIPRARPPRLRHRLGPGRLALLHGARDPRHHARPLRRRPRPAPLRSAAVSLIDFAGSVCPGGPPCPRSVHGIELRQLDGTHFTPDTAPWAAKRLLDTVLECRREPSGWQCPEAMAGGPGNPSDHK